MTPGPEMSPAPGHQMHRGAVAQGHMMPADMSHGHMAPHHMSRRDTMSQDRDKDKCIIS